jgi:hypothetical protein
MSEPWRALLTVFAIAGFGFILLTLLLLTLRPGLLRKGRLGSILSAFVERIGDIGDMGDIGGSEVERPEPPPDPRGRLLPFQPPAPAEKTAPPAARPRPEEEEEDETEVELRFPEA